MCTIPRFNAQAAVGALESKVDKVTSLMEAFLSRVGAPDAAATQAATASPAPQLPTILPINQSTILTEAPVRGNFLTKPELAERATATTGIHVEEGEEHFVEPLPKDDPNVKGPVWSGRTLRTKYGIFPAHHRRHDAQTKKLVTVKYDVSPADRSHFMAMTDGRSFGMDLTLAVPDGAGGERIVRFPSTGNVSPKQFSSFNHGLYGQIDEVVTLPDGSEYVLEGQVNLHLTKRRQ